MGKGGETDGCGEWEHAFRTTVRRYIFMESLSRYDSKSLGSVANEVSSHGPVPSRRHYCQSAQVNVDGAKLVALGYRGSYCRCCQEQLFHDSSRSRPIGIAVRQSVSLTSLSRGIYTFCLSCWLCLLNEHGNTYVCSSFQHQCGTHHRSEQDVGVVSVLSNLAFQHSSSLIECHTKSP